MTNSGAACGNSGLYESRCDCHSQCRLERRDLAPSCPDCGEPVGWTLVDLVPSLVADAPLEEPVLPE